MSSSATTVARSEPLTALLRSAQSRVSSVAALDVACEDTPISRPSWHFHFAASRCARGKGLEPAPSIVCALFSNVEFGACPLARRVAEVAWIEAVMSDGESERVLRRRHPLGDQETRDRAERGA